MAVADQLQLPFAAAARQQASVRILLLATTLGSAAATAYLIVCLLRLVFGPISALGWATVFAAEVIPALFLAGAMLLSRDENE